MTTGEFEIACWALLTTALVIGCVRLRGTTLWAAMLWALGSATAVAIVGVAEADSGWQAITTSAARFAAAATTFCPLMAVLGAKRPQQRGWQWVVLALWMVLVWPAAQAVLMAWRLFVACLIGMGLVNYLPTRQAIAAIAFAAGQFGLFAEYFDPERFPAGRLHTSSIFFFTMAALWPIVGSRMLPLSREPLGSLSLRWRRFRDGYGLLWGLRILGRVNETAQLSDWPVRLGWRGFHFTGEEKELSFEALERIEQTLDTLLRRFERVGKNVIPLP
jgi:hypothetical protein